MNRWKSSWQILVGLVGGGVRSHIFVGRYPSHFKTLASRHLIRIYASFLQVVHFADVALLSSVTGLFMRNLIFFPLSVKLYFIKWSVLLHSLKRELIGQFSVLHCHFSNPIFNVLCRLVLIYFTSSSRKDTFTLSFFLFCTVFGFICYNIQLTTVLTFFLLVAPKAAYPLSF